MVKEMCEQPENRDCIILKEAVENTNVAFVTIDKDHQVVFFNKAAEEIFGYSREEVLGRDLNLILTPRCSKDHRAAVSRYLKTKNPTLIGHETDFVAARKDGTTFPASISFSVSQVKGQMFFTALVRDVTERRGLQELVARSERLAALGQVVAEITHEIKNPLMLIGGFARQLKKAVVSEKDEEKLDIIASEVERLEKLIIGLRDLYLPASLSLSRIDINEVLSEVYALTEENCRQHRVMLSLKTDERAHYVEGDREKLKQVLINLVKNAVEAMPDGGDLVIQSQLRGSIVDVTIRDNGPGITEKNLRKIFSPFFTTKKGGSGLGLSICRRIIDEHKGCSFDLISEEGEGTAAIISFPVQQF